jgi:hypothetical protein
LFYGIAEPIQTLVEAFPGGRTGSLHVPFVSERGKLERGGYLCDRHGSREVLLVGKDENGGPSEFVFSEDPFEFVRDFVDSSTVCGVDNKNKAIGVGVVVAPEGSEFVLTWKGMSDGRRERRERRKKEGV